MREGEGGKEQKEYPDLVDLVDLGYLDLDEPPFEERPAHRVERTRAVLAYLLLLLLGGVIGILLLLLGIGRIDSGEFRELAGILIAPIVGLLGAATGYYYGKSSK